MEEPDNDPNSVRAVFFGSFQQRICPNSTTPAQVTSRMLIRKTSRVLLKTLQEKLLSTMMQLPLRR